MPDFDPKMAKNFSSFFDSNRPPESKFGLKTALTIIFSEINFKFAQFKTFFSENL